MKRSKRSPSPWTVRPAFSLAGVRSSKYGIKPFPEPPAFFPNVVMFQIGYNSDKPWWSKLSDPPKTIGDAIRKRVRQDMSVIWVDFYRREVLPTGAEKQP